MGCRRFCVHAANLEAVLKRRTLLRSLGLVAALPLLGTRVPDAAPAPEPSVVRNDVGDYSATMPAPGSITINTGGVRFSGDFMGTSTAIWMDTARDTALLGDAINFPKIASLRGPMGG